VFHPQILLHKLIAQRIVYDIAGFVPGDEEYQSADTYFSDDDSDSCIGGDSDDDDETGSTGDDADDGTGQGRKFWRYLLVDLPRIDLIIDLRAARPRDLHRSRRQCRDLESYHRLPFK
jgi:hypothetical protein